MNGPHPAFIFGDDLTVLTSGSFVDTIRTNGIQSANGVFTIITGNNTTLTATGSNSNGINVAQSPNAASGYGRVYIGNDSKITVAEGAAVRVNLTSQSPFYNLASIGTGATIKAGGVGNNGMNTQGYAVYAGNRDNVLTNGMAQGTNAVAIIGSGADISTTGANGHAVYANKGGVVQLQGGSVRALGTGADALRAEVKITPDNNNNALGGRIELAGNVSITVTDTAAAYAIHTLGSGSEVSSSRTNYYTGTDDKLYDGAGTIVNAAAKVTVATSGVYNITGNMFAESGLIDLHMTDGSVFTGATALGAYTHTDASGASVTDPVGVINLNIDGANSVWNMTASSVVTTVGLNGSTLNYLAPTGDPEQQSSYKQLTVTGDYTASNATLRMSTLLNAGGPLASQATDRLIVNGNAAGSTGILVNGLGSGAYTSTDSAALNSTGISLVQVAGTSTETAFTLANPGGYVGVGAFQYRLYAYGPGSTNGAASSAQNLTSNAAGTNWDYRLQNPYITPPPTDCTTTGTCPPPEPPLPPPTPQPEPPRPESLRPQVPTQINLPVAMMNAGFQDIDMLHRRLGELHDDNRTALNRAGERTDGDAFMRVYGGRFSYSSDRSYAQFGYGFDQDYTAVQMGANLFSWRDESAITRVGFALTFGDMRMTTNSPNVFEGTSKAQVNTYALQGYLTRQWDSGFYIDGVVSFGLMNGNVTANSIPGTADTVRGNSMAVGIELGRPWHFAQDWTLEPQVQIAYQHLGFNADNDNPQDLQDVTMQLGTAQQLIGRIGARLTRAFRSGENQLITPYAKLNLIHGFMDGEDVDIGGTTFTAGSFGTALQVGGGVTGTLSERWSVYGDAAWQTRIGDAGFGGWLANAGVRYVW